MGILKVIQNTDSKGDYLYNALAYIKRGSKAYNAYRVSPKKAYEQMTTVKKYFGKTSGNQLMHFMISFNENMDTVDKCKEATYEIAKYFGERFQVCYAIHYDPNCDENGVVRSLYHLHMIVNSVSYVDGKMFSKGKDDINRFMHYISDIINDPFIIVIYAKNNKKYWY